MDLYPREVSFICTICDDELYDVVGKSWNEYNTVIVQHEIDTC